MKALFMAPRQTGAILLVLLTACSGIPRVTHAAEDERELGPGVARYGLSVVSPRTVDVEPVEVDEDDFAEAVARLARDARPGARPQEEARRLFLQVREASHLTPAREGRTLRLAPVSKSPKDIPAADPVGDQLQAAAHRAAQKWTSRGPRPQEQEAIDAAASRGAHWLARLLERQARGRFVEKQLKDEFPGLKWNPQGVDAIDPTTSYRYEVLSGTDSNLALHGQRMASSFFRMITF